MNPIPALKDREREILHLLAEGKSDRAIAARLGIGAETVRWHNKQLYAKLGVASRTRAVERALGLGLLERPAPATVRPPVERSPIRYVSNDGVSIAWQAIGRGPVDLLFITGFLSHLELSWEDPGYTEFFETLGRHARVIIFDKRGVGLSDRTPGAATLEETISDARAVLRAAGSHRAFVSGTSEGGAASVLLASMHPEQVRGLVLIAATPLPARRGPDPEWARTWEEFERNMTRIVDTWGEPWAIDRFAPSRANDPAFAAWWSRALRGASSPSAARQILDQVRQVDIRALLPQVRTRTLVLHRTDDAIVRVGAARYLAHAMPDATLIELPGADHLYFVDPLPIASAIVRFLAAPDDDALVDTWIAIVLRMAGAGSSLDDEKASILRASQAQHVRTTPTGWVALFDSPNRAIRCAERFRSLGRGRAGGMSLHVGACRTADGAPVGAAHKLAERLVDAAAPAEVLVSGTLRDLVAGSGIELQPHSLDGGDAVTPAMTVWTLAPSSR